MTPPPTDLAILREVLVSELPSTLGTPSAPACYEIGIVLSRRISREEKALIESGQSHELLARAGFPDCRLTVVDRRLMVANTSLEQLSSGLARVAATIVRDACLEVDTARRERERQIVGDAERETARGDAVAELVRRIDLTPADLDEPATP